MVSSAALSCPGAKEGGDASPVGEFTHYRSRREGTGQVYRHKHTQKSSWYVCGKKAHCGRLARRADEEDPLTVARSTTNKLFGKVWFQASAGTKVRKCKPICFCYSIYCLYTVHNNTFISIFNLKEKKYWKEDVCKSSHCFLSKTHSQMQLFKKLENSIEMAKTVTLENIWRERKHWW